MTKELVKTDNKNFMFDPSNLTKETIKNYLCKDASDQELTLGLEIAKTCNLNPLKREIYFIKYGNLPMMVVTGYEVYIKRAEASGKYDGMELTSEGKIEDGTLKAIVKIYRKDWTRPLIHEVDYKEYVQNKGDGTPNKFWKEKPKTMIKKVAVSQGFRMAFPEQLNGLPYTADEAVDQEKIVDVQVEKAYESEPNCGEAIIPKKEPIKPTPVKQAPPSEALAEAEVVKPKPVTTAQPIKQPEQAPTNLGNLKTIQGIIIDKKIKPYINQETKKAGNKYGCKIGENWYGTFSSTVYDFITKAQAENILVDCQYSETSETKESKISVYYNIVSLKAVVANNQGQAPEQDI